MAQFGLPDSDVAAGSWTAVGGAGSLWNSVDDGMASDSEYMEDAGNNTTAELGLTTVTDPGVNTGHILRFRIQGNGSGGPERCKLQLFQGTTLIADTGNDTSRGSWNTQSDYTLAEVGEADQITDYSDLRIKVISSNLGGSETMWVSGVEFECPDASSTTYQDDQDNGDIVANANDTQLGNAIFPVSQPTEVGNADDTQLGNAIFPVVQPTEVANADDTQLGNAVFPVSQPTEAAQGSLSALVAVLVAFGGVTEAAQSNAAMSASVTHRPAVTEAAQANDTQLGNATFPVSVTEDAQAGDTQLAVMVWGASVTEDANADDTQLAVMVWGASVTEDAHSATHNATAFDWGVAASATAGYAPSLPANILAWTEPQPGIVRGIGIGWNHGGTPTVEGDEDDTVDRRLTGYQGKPNNNGFAPFDALIGYAGDSTTHPDSPIGLYEVRMAIGSASTAQGYQRVRLRDGESGNVLADYEEVGGLAAGEFIDATGVVRTSAADWVANNAPVIVNLQLTGVDAVRGKFEVTVCDDGANGGGGNGCIAFASLRKLPILPAFLPTEAAQSNASFVSGGTFGVGVTEDAQAGDTQAGTIVSGTTYEDIQDAPGPIAAQAGDTQLGNAVFPVSVTEDAQADDTQAAVVVWGASVTEAAQSNASFVSGGTFGVGVTEDAQANDTQVGVLTPAVASVTEAAQTGDTQVARFDAVGATTEAAQADDSQVATRPNVGTTIITLTGDTWVAAGAAFNAQRQAIIDGFDAAADPANGWNNEVRDKAVVTRVVRTSDTVVTVTWEEAVDYVIAATETITITIPAAALVTSGSAVIVSSTFDITDVGGTTYQDDQDNGNIAAQAGDTQLAVVVWGPAVTEAAQAGDTQAGILTPGIASVTEAAQAGDTQAGILTPGIASVTEAAQAGDTQLGNTTYPVSVTEDANADDAMAGEAKKIGLVTEDGNADDTMSAVVVWGASVTEDAQADDAQTEDLVGQDVAVTEDAQADDTQLGVTTIPVSVTEDAQAGDTQAGTIVSGGVTYQDDQDNGDIVANADDTQSAVVVWGASVTEDAQADDTQLGVNTLPVAVTEAAQSNAAFVGVLRRTGAVTEDAQADDTQAATLTRVGAVTEDAQSNAAFAEDLTGQDVAVAEGAGADDVMGGRLVAAASVTEAAQADDTTIGLFTTLPAEETLDLVPLVTEIELDSAVTQIDLTPLAIEIEMDSAITQIDLVPLVTEIKIEEAGMPATVYQEWGDKRIDEDKILTFNFTNRMTSAETISTQVVTAEVATGGGADPTPENTISGAASATGQIVSQKFIDGLEGVSYKMICEITTSLGQKLHGVGILKVTDL